jgi:hypothetical protein
MTTGLACLAIGLLGGYFLPRGATKHSALTGDKQSGDHQESVASAGNQPVISFLTQPKEAADAYLDSAGAPLPIPPPNLDYAARSEWLQKLPVSDLRRLVGNLCDEAGPEGLEYEDKSLIESALEKWWDRDSAGLLSWLRKLPNGGTKSYLVTEFLKDIGENDASRAKALAASFKAADPEWDNGEILNSLIRPEISEAWKKPGVSAEEILSLYERLSPEDRPQGHSVGIYPPDFDFRKFLNGLSALQEEKGGYERERPSDIIKEWSKTDPQAAAEWLIEEKSKAEQRQNHFSVGWRSLAEGVAAKSGPQAYHQWAAEIVTQSGAQVRDMILSESEDEDLVGIIGSIGNPTLREEVSLSQAVRRGDIEMFGRFSTAEARLSAIAQDPLTFSRWITRGKADPSFWPRAGLTAEQVATVLPETPPICPHCKTAHY